MTTESKSNFFSFPELMQHGRATPDRPREDTHSGTVLTALITALVQ
jgi:hypothetical protein